MEEVLSSLFIYFLLFSLALLPLWPRSFWVELLKKMPSMPLEGHRPDGKSPGWKIFGGIGMFVAFATMLYYPIVAGWVVEFFLKSVSLAHASQDVVNSTFGHVAGNFSATFLASAFVIILTSFVVGRGLVEGTEKVGLFLLPLLFVLLVVLAFRSLTLEGSSAGVSYYLMPDFSKVTGQTFLAALGQAFFSLSVGYGVMITFGSYMRKEACSVKSALSVMVADTLVAFFAGLIIMPALFAYGISPSAGPGLLFVSLPVVFSHMSGGAFWSPVFFFLIFIAAFTSTISLTEVLSTFISERFNMARKKAVSVLTAIQLVGMGIVLASQTGKISFKIAGMDFFDSLDTLLSNYLVATAALAVCLYVGIYHRKTIIEKADTLISAPFNKVAKPIVNTISFVLPVVIAFVLLSNIF